jgi:hypothetical protein
MTLLFGVPRAVIFDCWPGTIVLALSRVRLSLPEPGLTVVVGVAVGDLVDVDVGEGVGEADAPPLTVFVVESWQVPV